MTDEEKAAVAELNKRLMSKCACHCDADDNIVVDEMCLEHRMMIDDALKVEREACAKIADLFADECMRETYKAGGDKDAANAFRAQRVAAANIAGQIRRRKD